MTTKNEETINRTVSTIKYLLQVRRLNNNKLTKKTDRERREKRKSSEERDRQL